MNLILCQVFVCFKEIKKKKKDEKTFSELLTCVIFHIGSDIYKGNENFVLHLDYIKEDGRFNWVSVCSAAFS